jgi:D-alanyl-D-alanine dipeptidase
MSLFLDYKNTIIQSNPNLDDTTYTQMTQQFVSLPSNSMTAPSPHYTGGSIDLTIVDDSGRPLDMGTAFDDFTDAAHTAHYEHSDTIVRENRRLLYHLMTAAGFSNYPFEWWHYDYGNQFWAYRLEKPNAFYGPIDINPDA